MAAVADVVAYWSPDGWVASTVGGSIEFFMLPVIFVAVLWYGWVLRRRAHRFWWPGWALIAGLWVEHPVAFANSGSRITNFDSSADDDPTETE